ncbi:hypothetical protein JOS77_15125 [Chromobacterium haemolyticum]|nr:hypothetical protein JOS77_15125 [Chromobacterium haemolyticum]
MAHDHEGDQAGDGVAQNHRRAGGFQHAGRTEEQSGAYRAAQRDQLYVAVFQAAFQTGFSGDISQGCPLKSSFSSNINTNSMTIQASRVVPVANIDKLNIKHLSAD